MSQANDVLDFNREPVDFIIEVFEEAVLGHGELYHGCIYYNHNLVIVNQWAL